LATTPWYKGFFARKHGLYAVLKIFSWLIKEGLELSGTIQGIADVVITYQTPENIDISEYINLSS
jgi:hypothetical protein